MTIWVGACDASLGSGVVEHSADVMEHLTYLDAAADKFVPGCDDLVDDED